MPRVERADKPRGGEAPKPAFVELPTGLFTASGTWFRISLANLEAYAGPLVERVGVAALLASADSVLRAPQTLALWFFLAALVLATPFEAALSGIIVFAVWTTFGPGLVLPGLLPLLGVLERVWLQAVAFVTGLSALAWAGSTGAVAVGLAGFVVLRWGLLSLAVEPLTRWPRGRLYRLPAADQALRAVIVRHALRERVTLPAIEEMEARVMQMTRRRSRGKDTPRGD